MATTKNKAPFNQPKNVDTIEYYSDDPDIASYDAKVPSFLIFTYLVLPIWGIAMLYVYWNGSIGVLERGSWHQLQVAANTTLPYENHSLLPNEQESNQDSNSNHE